MKRMIIGCLALITLSAHAIPFSVANKISRGQTEAEVLVIAGNPDNQSYAGRCNKGVGYQWLYMKKDGDDRNVLVTFCSGKVEQVENVGWR